MCTLPEHGDRLDLESATKGGIARMYARFDRMAGRMDEMPGLHRRIVWGHGGDGPVSALTMRLSPTDPDYPVIHGAPTL